MENVPIFERFIIVTNCLLFITKVVQQPSTHFNPHSKELKQQVTGQIYSNDKHTALYC